MLLTKKLFLTIVIASFLVRIIRFDYPLSFGFAWGDGTRDFFVASHILKYGELSLLGPFNLLSEMGVKNSPVYFYLLSLILILFNNILTLSLVNILLQVGVVILIYLISKKLFDQKTALLSMILFSFNFEILHLADFIWQPNLMMPLALAGWYLWLSGFLTRSMVIFSLAFAIHNSAFPWVLTFLALSIKNKRTILVLIISLLIFFMPVLIYFKLKGFNFNFGVSNLYILSLKEYLLNLQTNTLTILTALNMSSPIILLITTILTARFFKKIKDLKLKKNIILLLVLSVLPIVFASLFSKIRLHYLLLSIPSIIVLISKLITSQKSKIALIVITIIYLYFLSSGLKFLENSDTPLGSQKMIDSVSRIIKDELTDIQKTKNFKDFKFFQIRSYAMNDKIFYYPTLDTILLVPLENTLNQRLAKISDDSFYNHNQIGKSDYILVVCHQFSTTIKFSDCLDFFLKESPRYVILKHLYLGDALSIYIAKAHE